MRLLALSVLVLVVIFGSTVSGVLATEAERHTQCRNICHQGDVPQDELVSQQTMDQAMYRWWYEYSGGKITSQSEGVGPDDEWGSMGDMFCDDWLWCWGDD